MSNYYARQNKPRVVDNKPKQPTESQIQQAVIEWCGLQQYKGRPLAYYVAHVPNGGNMSARAGNKLKKEGVQKGYPDLLMDIPKGGYHGLRLELKRLNGGVVSKEQKERISVLLEEGYQALVVRGYDETVKAIQEYLNLDQ